MTSARLLEKLLCTHFPFLITMFMFLILINSTLSYSWCTPGTGTIGVTVALWPLLPWILMYVGAKKMGYYYILSLHQRALTLLLQQLSALRSSQHSSSGYSGRPSVLQHVCRSHRYGVHLQFLASMYLCQLLRTSPHQQLLRAGFSDLLGSAVDYHLFEKLLLPSFRHTFLPLYLLFIQLVESEH